MPRSAWNALAKLRDVASSLLRRRSGRMECAAATGRGKVRPDNQDDMFVLPGCGVFCVADGMGGGCDGAKASRMACSELRGAASLSRPLRDVVRAVSSALDKANADIFAYGKAAGYGSMGTTVALLAAAPAGAGGTRQAVAAHVGDSRIYRFRAGRLERLTRDHTFAEDAEIERAGGAFAALAAAGRAGARRTHLSHVLTRALGTAATVKPGWRKIDVRPGDAYLLCSDGVTDMVPEDSLRFAFATGRTPQGIVDTIERKTLAAGAKDNYTIVVVLAR